MDWPLRRQKPEQLTFREYLEEEGWPRFRQHGRGFLMFLGGVLVLETVVYLAWHVTPAGLGSVLMLGAIYAITLFLALRD